MKKLLFLFAALFLAAAKLGYAATPENHKKVALVIGNSTYAYAVTLPNPTKDAVLMAAKLRDAGFTVIEGENLDKIGMSQAIDQFTEAAYDADVALVYYSGHGLQVDEQNYLIPVDTQLEKASQLQTRTIPLGTLMNALPPEPAVSIVILDACRDNPLARSLAAAFPKSRSSSVGAGLAAVQASGQSFGRGGLLIAYATDPKAVAYDGDGENSPYTTALAKHLTTPGLEIQSALTRVRAEVSETTNGAQRPWVSASLAREVFLGGDLSKPQTPPVADSAVAPAVDNDAQVGWTVEQKLWDEASKRNTAAHYQLYLSEFPNGKFAAVAKLNLDLLKGTETTPPAPPSTEGEAKTVAAPPLPPTSTEGEAKTAAAPPTPPTSTEGEAKAAAAPPTPPTSTEGEAKTAAAPPTPPTSTEGEAKTADAPAMPPTSTEGEAKAAAAPPTPPTSTEGEVKAAAAPPTPPTSTEGEVKIASAPQSSSAVAIPEVVKVVPGTAETEAKLNLNKEARIDLQMRLGALGYNVGGFDGSLGPRARSAIAAWQRDNSMIESGYLTGEQRLSLVLQTDPLMPAFRAQNEKSVVEKDTGKQDKQSGEKKQKKATSAKSSTAKANSGSDSAPAAAAPSTNKKAASRYCTEYDVASQSRVPCGSLTNKPKSTGKVKTSSNYCTEYDIYSQTMVPCGSAKAKPRNKVRVKKATDYCTKYDVKSQSYEPC